MDYDYTLFGTNTDVMTIIFMSCHIAGMCSACINPVIYGFCNESIRSGNNIILKYNVSFNLKLKSYEIDMQLEFSEIFRT